MAARWDARSIRAFVACSEFQTVQLDLERIERRYVPDGSGRVPDVAGLAAFAHDKFHPSVEIILVPLEAIPRGPGGKFEQVLSHVPIKWTPTLPSRSPPVSQRLSAALQLRRRLGHKAAELCRRRELTFELRVFHSGTTCIGAPCRPIV